jgi:hypothetical protein
MRPESPGCVLNRILRNFSLRQQRNGFLLIRQKIRLIILRRWDAMNIKKTVLYLLSGFLLSLAVSSSAAAQEFEGGIMAGLCASQVAGDTYSGYDKAGIFAGGYVSLPVSSRADLRLELGYIQKGSRKNPVPDNGDYDSYLMRLGYIEMPFLFQYHIGSKLMTEVGPAISYLLHSGEKYNRQETSYHPFKKQNLSIIAGISYPLTEKISAGLRTNDSLFSIRKDKVTGDVWRLWGFGQFNDVLVLTFGYKL